MFLYRKKVGKLKGLTYTEVHKIVNNLPDKIHAEYREMFGNCHKSPTGVKHIVTLYRKGKHDK